MQSLFPSGANLRLPFFYDFKEKKLQKGIFFN